MTKINWGGNLGVFVPGLPVFKVNCSLVVIF